VPTKTYAVNGMTCEHCAQSVRSEVGALPGVEAVTVELVPDGPSRLTVSGRELAGAELAGALAEAGDYALVNSP
jgi:copper chaperone